ncbi:MAG TPA: phospholipase D-like domain-containing protein [Myxococcales bacterium]|jgi:cardiolipin synthase
MRSLLVLLLCGAMAGCFGRLSDSEFRLDGPDVENTDFANALYQTTGARMVPGNLVVPVDNGRVFDAAIDAIHEAKESVHILTFIWSDGRVSNRFIDAIAARIRAGVRCRVIVDALGSPDFGNIQRRLELLGCEAYRFRLIPGQDDVSRVHRKIIIVDGRVGFTGGFGIDDRWDGDGLHDDPPQWRDSNVMVRGPVVNQMQQAFSEEWQEVTGSLLPVSSFPQIDPHGPTTAAFVTSVQNSVVTKNERLTQLFIASAKRRIWIANAYFLPSQPIVDLLARKAHSGVDVRVLAAGERTDTRLYLPEQRARMAELAAAGVRAFEYTPTMMHAKTMILDDRYFAVGSCNLDPLSLMRMDEGALVVDDAKLAADETARLAVDFQHSTSRLVAQRH